MTLKPSATEAALVEEAVEAKLEGGGLETAERDMLEGFRLDLRRYRVES